MMRNYFTYPESEAIRRKAKENTEAFDFAFGLCKAELVKCYIDKEKLVRVEQIVKNNFDREVDLIVDRYGYRGGSPDVIDGYEDHVAENVAIAAVIKAVINVLDDDRPDLRGIDYKVANKNSTFTVYFPRPYAEYDVIFFP